VTIATASIRDRRSGRAVAGLLATALILGAVPAAVAQSQAPSDAGFVELLLSLGLPVEAGREARRLMLLHGSDVLPPAATFRVGMALALAGEATDAVPFLTQAAGQIDDPVVADQWQLAAGVALLRARSFPYALQLFVRVETFGADATTRGRATRFRCIGQVLAGEGAAARSCVAALPAARPARAAEIRRLLDRLDINVKTRGVVGGVLSAVIPGLGQATGGEPGDALLALLVNGAWGTGTVLLVLDKAIFEAGLLALGFGLRYYMGNIRNGSLAWEAAAVRSREEAAIRLVRLIGDERD
jgi:TM2 domain-containing membrane protein YozV